MASRTTSRARRRSDKPRDVWKQAAKPVRVGDERLRFFAVRPGLDDVPLADAATAVRWDDVTMELTGSLDLILPRNTLSLQDGHRIRAEYAPSANAAFRRLWTMTFGGKDSDGVQRSLSDDSVTAALTSTLSDYRGDRMDFHFRRDKAHPKGWLCHEIVREVGRLTGLPLGQIAKGTHPIRSLVRRNADPLDVIVLAYRQEREATGRRYVATWTGRLNITRLQRSEYLLELLPVLMDGSYTTQRRTDFATVLNVRATAKTGRRKTRKIRVRVTDADGVKRYGVFSRTAHPGGIDTEAEARAWARRSLRKRLAPKREFTVTVPLMPTVKRGDALRVRWQDEAIDQIAFVRAASHEWTPGGGTTQVTVRFDDPFVDDRARKNARSKAKAARDHGRPSPKSSPDPVRDRRRSVQPKNRQRRGDK